jgi:two-component system, NtrC family, nitrogen regulation sensor histidine kinase NtrY
VELMQSRRLSVLSLLDAHGKTLASGHLPAAVGDVDSVLFGLTRAGGLAEHASVIETRTDQGLIRVPALVAVAAPTYAYGDVRSWVVGGTSLDMALCERLSWMTGARVELWMEGTQMGAAGLAPFPMTRSLDLGPHIELRISFGTDALRQAEHGARNALLGTTAAALAAALLFGYFVSRRTTRPLEALTQATRQVAAGKLDQKVHERATGELAELVVAFNRMTQDLQSATSRLIAAERVAAWQEVARRLAHELKNPLTPIQMSLETLMAAQRENHPSFNTLFPQSAAAVLEEVERLRRIVDEFSRFARLPKPQLAPVDLSELAGQVISLYPPDARVRITSDLQQGVGVRADRDQMTQVVLNLLQNAHEAMPEGGHVWIRVAQREGQAMLEVEDTGPGVPPELRERIFEPYFTQKSTGTGLGLAIAARICHEHGGTLELQSTEGTGARFVLSLPLQPSQPTQARTGLTT